MAAIAKRMGDRQVSIESMVQRRPPSALPGIGARLKPGAPALVVLITHETTEEAIRQAIDAIERRQGVGATADDPHREAQRGRLTDRGGVHAQERTSSSASTACWCSRWPASPKPRRSRRRICAGAGDEKAADQAAVDAMRRELAKLPIRGTVVIGEGETRRSAHALHRREGGLGAGPRSTSRSIRSRARRSAPRRCQTRWP